jgi:hypothetical protein
MKKLIAISILLTVLTAGAFAQFGVEFSASFFPDLIRATAPLDDAANKDKPAYAGVGTFDFFTMSDWPDGSEVRAKIFYNDKDGNYGGLLQLKADHWLARDNTLANTGSLVDILQTTFGDWNVWGKVGILKGFVGNTSDRGAVKTYDGTFNYFFEGVKVDQYGISLPAYVKTLDVRNVKEYGYIGGALGNPYFSITADLSPIKVVLAGDMSQVFTENTAGESYGKANVALRVSAEKIIDILTLDAIYKLSGSDPYTDDKVGTQPDGAGRYNHNFGVFANVDILDGLGIGVGYSGLISASEDRDNGTNTTKSLYPYYNGIDLRFNFTGIDKLTVTFNNNISFSAVTGDDDSLTYDYGVLGTNELGGLTTIGAKRSDNYIALYNALGVNFALTDQLTVIAGAANRFYSYLYKDTNSPEVARSNLSDNLRIAAGASYALGTHVTLEGGLAFDINHSTTTQTSQDDSKAGTFTFAIPLHLKVVF